MPPRPCASAQPWFCQRCLVISRAAAPLRPCSAFCELSSIQPSTDSQLPCGISKPAPVSLPLAAPEPAQAHQSRWPELRNNRPFLCCLTGASGQLIYSITPPPARTPQAGARCPARPIQPRQRQRSPRPHHSARARRLEGPRESGHLHRSRHPREIVVHRNAARRSTLPAWATENIRPGDEFCCVMAPQPIWCPGSCCCNVPVRCCAMPPHRKPRSSTSKISSKKNSATEPGCERCSDQHTLCLNPIEAIRKLSHDAGALLLVMRQSLPHLPET